MIISSLCAQNGSDWDVSRSKGGWGEKLGNKIGKSIEKRRKKRNAPVAATQTANLYEIASKYPPKSKMITFSRYSSSDMLKAGSYGYVKLEKDEHNRVSKVKLGYGLDKESGDLFRPDVYQASRWEIYRYYPWFFTNGPFIYSYEHVRYGTRKVYVTDKSIVNYEIKDIDKPDVKYIETIFGDKGKRKNAEKWRKEIEAYRRLGLERVKQDQVKLQEGERQFRVKHSLENKQIKTIKPVIIKGFEKGYVIKEDKIVLGFEVLFKDETSDKTFNLGGNLYMEDFETDYAYAYYNLNQPYKVDSYGAHQHTGKDATLTIDYEVRPNQRDVVKILFKSRYSTDGQYTMILPIKYHKSHKLRTFGKPLNVKVITSKHSETGEPLAFIKSGKKYYKCTMDKPLNLDASGYRGFAGSNGEDCWFADCKASDGKNGSSGGDGQIIYLEKSAGLEKFRIITNVKGGEGGEGGRGGNCHARGCVDGQSGKKGSVGKDGKVIVKRVSAIMD